LDTAATSSGPAIGPMPAEKIGKSISNRSHSGVLNDLLNVAP
jgi:hypothetical protein